ncbi:MAG: hypothetical protein U0929_12600 [Planctomycetaceae bacterium]
MRSAQFPFAATLAAMFLAGALPLTAAEPASQPPSLESIHSQPSWVIRTPQVELAVTEIGGHMAPVTFCRDAAHPVQPYHITPWQDEPKQEMPAPVLVPLRGDFFCMPFGGNAEAVNGEKHPPHGEVAGAPWKLINNSQSGDVASLTLEFTTHVRPGKVTKELSLVKGQNVVYSRHTIEGFAGSVPLGHHATLTMPDEEGRVRLSSSRMRFGMTYPGVFSDPKSREYQSLLPGTQWTDMTKVPALAKNAPSADLTRLPARFGFADLVQLINDPSVEGPAWMAATYADQGYVWFSLKDPRVLASTVLWIENHGRHGHPWNGRNHCLGVEDVTSHFADGLAASIAENVLSKQGIPTSVSLTNDHPTHIHYIQGVAQIPAGFEQVETITFAPEQITLKAPTGQSVTVPVQHEFLKTGSLRKAGR